MPRKCLLHDEWVDTKYRSWRAFCLPGFAPSRLPAPSRSFPPRTCLRGRHCGSRLRLRSRDQGRREKGSQARVTQLEGRGVHLQLYRPASHQSLWKQEQPPGLSHCSHCPGIYAYITPCSTEFFFFFLISFGSKRCHRPSTK